MDDDKVKAAAPSSGDAKTQHFCVHPECDDGWIRDKNDPTDGGGPCPVCSRAEPPAAQGEAELSEHDFHLLSRIENIIRQSHPDEASDLYALWKRLRSPVAQGEAVEIHGWVACEHPGYPFTRAESYQLVYCQRNSDGQFFKFYLPVIPAAPPKPTAPDGGGL
jgi:hypothetical protein